MFSALIHLLYFISSTICWRFETSRMCTTCFREGTDFAECLRQTFFRALTLQNVCLKVHRGQCSTQSHASSFPSGRSSSSDMSLSSPRRPAPLAVHPSPLPSICTYIIYIWYMYIHGSASCCHCCKRDLLLKELIISRSLTIHCCTADNVCVRVWVYVCVCQICMWVCGCVSNMYIYMLYHMAVVHVADAIPLAKARR